jgi:hypothetical protein
VLAEELELVAHDALEERVDVDVEVASGVVADLASGGSAG